MTGTRNRRRAINTEATAKGTTAKPVKSHQLTSFMNMKMKLLLIPLLMLFFISVVPIFHHSRESESDDISTKKTSAVRSAATKFGSSTPLLNIGRRNGTHAIINIGSNLDPIVPNENDNPCTIALAFEPIVAEQIPAHPSLHVIPAAVSSESGWSAMNMYNKDGKSSSLNKAAYSDYWNRNSELKIVPMISFRTVLESLRHYEIDFILTDMQGHDFTAVSSVGTLLRDVGVKRMVTEVYKDNVSTYAGSQNDFCRHWLPHMTKIGYVFEGLTKMMGDTETILEGFGSAEEAIKTCEKDMRENREQKTGLNEYNAFWRLESATISIPGLKPYKYGTHSSKKGGTGFKFTDEQYKKC